VSTAAQTIFSKVRKLAPQIAARSAEIEQGGRIPDDLFRELTAAGCFRMLVPASHGGAELEFPEILAVIEELSRADGSTGWIVGQAASAQLIFSHYPADVIDQIYSEGPDVLGAGAVAPKGRAVVQDRGWKITGQWPFVTGCDRASWIYLQCMVVENRKIQFLPNGSPLTRMMLLPATAVEIVNTWEVSGLRSTASHDVRAVGALCPRNRSAAFTRSEMSLSGAIFRIPLIEQGGLYVAAVAIGIARGAVEDIAALAPGKRPALRSGSLADCPSFQEQLGVAYMELEAARALLDRSAGLAWQASLNQRPLAAREQAMLRATVAQVTATSARAVDIAYALAGGTAVYNQCSLQRRFRDIHTLTQHAYTGRHFYSVLGAVIAGKNVGETLL
jgi:alkylation response protein AidB-like acyl-CoA dehydrogenase